MMLGTRQSVPFLPVGSCWFPHASTLLPLGSVFSLKFCSFLASTGIGRT